MQALIALIVAFAASLPSTPAVTPPLPKCADTLKPVQYAPPKLTELHHTFQGTASFEVIVLPSGKIESLVMLTSQWEPVGGHGSTRSADRLVGQAVAQWIYPSVKKKCRKVVKITVKME